MLSVLLRLRQFLIAMDSERMATDLATPSSTARHLPAPAELPDADVIIFDGACGFCQKQVSRLFEWDGRGRIAFLSIGDPEVKRRWPELSEETLMKNMHVIDRFGGVHVGAKAFRYLSRRLPRLWPLAALMHIPLSGPMWNMGYRWFARRRYRLSQLADCPNGKCDIHVQ